MRPKYDAMNLSLSGRDAAEAMINFIADQAWVARLGGECLIGSTEILESFFGDLKTLERQQSESGLTGLMLAFGAMMSEWTVAEIKKALDDIPWKAVEAWIEERLGATVQSQRRNMRKIFADP